MTVGYKGSVPHWESEQVAQEAVESLPTKACKTQLDKALRNMVCFVFIVFMVFKAGPALKTSVSH